MARELGVPFDVAMIVDLDVFSIDFRTFMNELFYSKHSALCAHGVGVKPYTFDTFAFVKKNGGWLHYGHDVFNRSQYVYNNSFALLQRQSVPNMTRRFEPVRSC